MQFSSDSEGHEQGTTGIGSTSTAGAIHRAGGSFGWLP